MDPYIQLNKNSKILVVDLDGGSMCVYCKILSIFLNI